MSRHLAAALVVFASPVATADVQPDGSRCTDADVDLAWVGTDFAEIGGDTGWFPAGFPAQLRLAGRVIGETAVESGVEAKACWHDGMSATVAPRAGTGWLDVAYGAELHAYAKIDTSILGKKIYWEGELPIPYIPSNLMVGGASPFDPSLDGYFDGAITDASAPITLLSSDVIGDLIGIVGISGGIRITVTPSMVTSYGTTAFHLGNGVMRAANDELPITAPQAGFGAALELPAKIDGLVRYRPALRFDVRFDIKILGVRVVDWQLFSVPMNLPSVDRPVTLTADGPARLGLPALDGVGGGARLDFSSATKQALVIRNQGERPLTIAASVVPVGVTVQPLTIQPGRDGHLEVTVPDPTALGSTTQTLALSTNDPDHPTFEVALGVDIGGTDPGDVEVPAEAGGCHSGGGAGGWLFALGFVVLVRRRLATP